jgi:hypothetical protein
MLINGDFRVWQKGTDLNTATTGNAVTTADRWTTQYVDFAPRIRKVEDTLANNEIVDTAEITKISGTYASCEFSQKVETTVAKYLRGRTVTFSFWIKKVGSTFGSHNYDCWIGDSETVDDTVWTNTRTADRGRITRQSGISAAVTFTDNIWRKITITRTLTSDTNTIYCTIYTQNTPTNEGIRIANCQLELGSVVTPFEKRPLAMELAMCQRYYHSLGGDTPYQSINTCVYYSTSEAVGFFRHPVEMRATPVIAKTGNWSALGGGGAAGATVNADQNGPKTTQLGFAGGSSGTSGQGTTLRGNNDSNLRVTFNAEF